MNDQELINAVNIMSIQARVQALENYFWGYLTLELGKTDELAPALHRKVFLNFYIENLNSLKDSLPPVLADSLVVKNALKGMIADTEKQIQLLS